LGEKEESTMTGLWLEVGVMYQYGPFDILHIAKEGHIFQECPCDQGINLGINYVDI
jgi:hypothetical protein